MPKAAANRIIIGLEVHVELKTVSKMFCACSAEHFGAEPNTHTCPVCLGMPGVLPVMNRRAYELAVRAALGLGCEIATFTKWDRKNYYYPDLPKNYQISQYDMPLSSNGSVEIETKAGRKKIRILRVHLEEDTGSLKHAADGRTSMVDLNRAGVPLLEIVSEPDMDSVDEARAYAEELRRILRYLDVSDCNMQMGQLRYEPNINLAVTDSQGAEHRTPIVELKNLNSFRAVERATAYEARRQLEAWEQAGETAETHPKETRGWDDERGITISQREKEEVHDYRYFPEPDLAPVTVTEEWIDGIRRSLPELPSAKRARYVERLGLPVYDAEVLSEDRQIAEYFEEVAEASGDAKSASNWVMGEVSRELKARNLSPVEFPVRPEKLGALIKMVGGGAVSMNMAREIFAQMASSGRDPAEIAREKGYEQISDEDELGRILEQVIAANPDPVADFRAGKKQALSFLMGQVMKATRGQANPRVVSAMLAKKLA
jgi:aspartyl-tRNA(Asn)/glutamyl-tRNA(Gln) amidotransferase subunit B